ncbi:MAG: MmcQ/YjbR family DNA-binding protein [Pseudomonadota bacterium]
MTEAEIDAHCLACPGATKVVQWADARVYKVGEKVFAILPRSADRITLKCPDPEMAAFLIEIGAATRAPHLPRGGWVSLPVTETGDLAARLTQSYDTVRASLPKRVRGSL